MHTVNVTKIAKETENGTRFNIIVVVFLLTGTRVKNGSHFLVQDSMTNSVHVICHLRPLEHASSPVLLLNILDAPNFPPFHLEGKNS